MVFRIGFVLSVTVALSCVRSDGVGQAPAAVRLADVFASEMIVDPVAVVEQARSEWRLADLADGWTWRAAAGIAGTSIGEDGLRATVRSGQPVLVVEAPATLGDGDGLHAIEVRMRVSAGETLRLTVLGEDGPPAEAFAGEKVPFALSTPLLPGDEMATYRIELVRSMVLGPFSRKDPRRVVLSPSDVAGAEVVLESVRLIFHREHLAAVPSGLGWHGLGDIWRETLVSRPGETLRLPVRVPAGRPVLDLSLGTPEDAPLRFEASVDDGDRRHRVLQRTLTQPERWEDERVDLAGWAGREVVLELRAESDEAATVALWGSPALRSRGVGQAAPDAAAPQGVIVVIADTLRRDHLDAWGYGRDTAPTLSRLADEGVRFEDTVAQAVWTKVSVPSILSSLYPTAHGVVTFTDRLPAAATTLAEAFQAAGYATMATSAWAFTGQLTNLHQGVELLYEGGSVDLPEGASGTKTARFFVDRLLEFVERHEDLPFLAVLHTGDPHSPYEPLGRYADLWTEEGGRERHREQLDQVMPHIESDFFRRFQLPTAADLDRAGLPMEPWRDHEIGWYDGSIRFLDAEIGRLVDRLEHLGLRDRVVIAFVSDHGEEFFEHGRNWHGLSLYGHQTDVPFVLWGPGFVPGGVVVRPPVQLIDVLPTLLALAGIERPETAQGRDLTPLVAATKSGEGAPRVRPAFSERKAQGVGPGFPPDTLDNSWAVLTSEWRLIRNPDPPPGVPEYELYDRRSDPLSLTDVAGEHADVVTALASQLAGWRTWVERHKLDAESTGDLPAEELEKLRSLGYI